MRTQNPTNATDQKPDTERFTPKPISARETALMTVKILGIGGGALAALWWLSQ